MRIKLVIILSILYFNSLGQFFNNDEIDLFKFGLNGGINVSKIKDDSLNLKNIALPHIGFSGIFNFNKKFSTKIGFNNSYRGGNTESPIKKYRINFQDYFIAPRFRIIPSLYFELGFQYSILFSQHYKTLDGQWSTGEEVNTIKYYNSRPEIFTGFDFELHDRLSLNIKYSLPTKNIESSNLMFGITIILTKTNFSNDNITANTFEELLKEPLKYTKFYAKDKNISSIPNDIGKCLNLEEINLNNNNIEILPDEFCRLINLTKLYLNNNYLQNLPSNFGELSNLKYLELSNNKLEVIPNSFCLLRNLIQIDLSENKLTSLPDDIGKLENLVVFKLINSGIFTIPNSIENLKKLEYLYIDKIELLKIEPKNINPDLKINGTKIKK